jgi:hypothetical protein
VIAPPLPVTFQALDEGARLVDYPLPLAEPPGQCRARLRVLPGAEGVHVALVQGGTTLRRYEVPGLPGELVPLEILWELGAPPRVVSPGRPVLVLPVDTSYQPLAPLFPPRDEGTPLDLVLLIDGTLRWFRPPEGEAKGEARWVSEQLLGARARSVWRSFQEELVALVAELCARHPDARCAALAFGDATPPLATAADLKADYVLFPPSPRLRTLDLAGLRRELAAIPPTSGGDFVDELAEGLRACAQLHWRQSARKLLLLVGDSPGESVDHPAPTGASARPRKLDVDHEVAELHRRGVELGTVYVEPPADAGLQALGPQASLLRYARDQYQRLASWPGWAFLAPPFEGPKAAEALLVRPAVLARAYSVGQLVEITP